MLSFVGHGTLFLSEIDQTYPPIFRSSSCGRCLKKEFTPISSTSPMPFHARVIAATDRDLPAEVKAGVLREDLYLGLNAMQINLPPLRDRKSDIPLLADFFVDKYAKPGADVEISGRAMKCLLAYNWPGNVQELGRYRA